MQTAYFAKCLRSSGLHNYRILCKLHSAKDADILDDSAQVVWDVTLCCWVSIFWRFERTQCLHLQGLRTNGKTRRENPEDLNSQQHRCENLGTSFLWRTLEFFYIITRQFLLITNLTHFFYVFMYFTTLHVSSNPVLIIRRINCINISSGMYHCV
jgi:hypothetical protein